MRLEPAQHLFGVGIGRKDGVEDMLDPPTAHNQREALQEYMPSGTESRQTKRAGQAQLSIREKTEREVQASGCFALTGRLLSGEADNIRPGARQLLVMITETAGFERASSRAWNEVPVLCELSLPGWPGARIGVYHRALAGAGVVEEDHASIRCRKAYPGEGHARQVTCRAVICRYRQVRRQGGQVA